MKLNREDLDSRCWKLVAAWAEEELVRLANLLKKDSPEVPTAKLRGEIAAFDRLLALGVEKKALPQTESLDHLHPT